MKRDSKETQRRLKRDPKETQKRHKRDSKKTQRDSIETLNRLIRLKTESNVNQETKIRLEVGSKQTQIMRLNK